MARTPRVVVTWRTVASEDGWGRDNYNSPNTEITITVDGRTAQAWTVGYMPHSIILPRFVQEQFDALNVLFPRS